MEQFTDQLLVEEVQGGSRVAFDELMRRHEGLVYRVCYSYTRDPEDAMDVTQEVFLRVYAKIDTFRGSGAFRSWLLRVAHRENLNWLRDHRRHREWETLAPEEVPRCPATQESDLLADERRSRVTEALESLNPRERLGLTLRYHHGMRIREIAAVLKCTEGTAKSILFRGLKKVRRLTVPYMEDPI
jgi:RNA polymerase sigma-70 factor (ECF subfamily)